METNRTDTALLSVAGVSKSYSGVSVLRAASFSIEPGESIALAGENGAGKSTLLNIIAGLVPHDAGKIVFAGDEIQNLRIDERYKAGISVVPQELAPLPDLNIYQNIFLGRELKIGPRILAIRRMRKEAQLLLAEFGLKVDARTLMRNLSVAIQQQVEILKAVSSGVKVLLLDEPTSAISHAEVESLYAIISRLRQRGVAIIFTTHKMDEMRAAATRVVVLRDGTLIEDKPMDEITDEQIVSAMIGRELGDLFPDRSGLKHADGTVFEVVDLVRPGLETPISLTVRAGEIVALTGLVGAGRTELVEALFGIRKRTHGSVLVGTTELVPNKPHEAIKIGIALVPEERKVAGGVLEMSILNNGLLPHIDKYTKYGFLDKKSARNRITTVMEKFSLRYRDLDQKLMQLSGGNQQKVVLGRWLTHEMRVLLLDEPTRGVDIGARGEIYRLIRELAKRDGVGILMISSDMAEVIGLADRALVMADNDIVGEVNIAGSEQTMESLQAQLFEMASNATEAFQA